MAKTRGRKKNYAQRNSIIAKSYELFTERPYEEITTRLIAAECGIERSLLHYYFNKKEDIVASILVLITASIRDYLVKELKIGRSTPHIMGYYYALFLNTLEKQKGLKTLYLVLLGSTTKLMETIYEAIDPDDDVLPFIGNRDEEIAFILANGCISQLLMHGSAGELELEPAEVIRTVIRMHYLYLGEAQSALPPIYGRIERAITPEKVAGFIHYYESGNHWRLTSSSTETTQTSHPTIQ